jgi:hypothetical protein
MKNKPLLNQMKKAFMPLILSMLLVSCSKPDTDNGGSPVVTPVPLPQECKECVCDVKDPPNDLPWLKGIINATAPPKLGPLSTIYAYTYKGKQVIYVSNLSSSQLPMQVYDCKGNIVFSHEDFALAPLKWAEFLDFTRNEKTGEKLLWKKD